MNLIQLLWLAGLIGTLKADLMSEPSAIEFNVETNQPSGTLIGSIRDYSSNHMQPPYYVIPIQPDNQELFNRDILIDLDTGKITSNSILNTNRINQYKFSALSINEGLANLIIINVIDKSLKSNELNETSEDIIMNDLNSNRNIDKCIELTPNRPITVNNNLKTIYNCFQLDFEPINTCHTTHDWLGVFLIKCNMESSAYLTYINRQSVESFEFDNSTEFETKINTNLNDFQMKSSNNKLQVDFECNRVEFKFFINLNLTNQSTNILNSDLYSSNNLAHIDLDLNDYLKYFDQKNKSKIIVISHVKNQSDLNACFNHTDNLTKVIDDLLNSTSITTFIVPTTTLYNIIRINTFSQNYKIGLILLSVLILSLVLLLFGLFICYKKDSSSKSESSKQFTSSSNLTYKTQTSTINSKFNDDTNEDTSTNYFSLIVSHFQRNSIKNGNDLKQNTIKSFSSSQDNSNLLTSQSKLDNDGLFSYSNGYLAEIGINMMDNLNCLNTQNRTHCLENNLASASQLWSQDQSLVNKTSLDDEQFQKWCTLLGWKPEYNDISCVLNDLALLNDMTS